MTHSRTRNVPEGFYQAAGLVPLRSVAASSPSKVTPRQMQDHTVTHYSIPAVQEFGIGVEEDGGDIASDKWLVSRPVVLISKLNPRKSTVTRAVPDSGLTVASSEFVPISTGNEDDDRYLAYVLASDVVARHLDSLVTSATRSHQRVSPGDILSMSVPWPSRSSRRAMADFLDRETAQIDAMIEAQRDLVTALQMRRLALVVDGVHLGSGPECLPEGWETLPFKAAVSRRFTGEWGTEPGSDEVDVACVRVADFDRSLRRAGASIPTVRSMGADKARTKALRPGDLLLERSGGTARNPVGNIVLYVGPEGALSSNFIECVRLKRGHDPQFWCYLHEAAYSTGFTHQHVKQTTGIQNLDVDGFYAEHFAVPALDEQRRIAEELSAKTSTLDAAIAAAIDVASLLRERREALIAAAVTGRIDPATGVERIDPTTEKEAS